jgi:Carboxypeptidase regulatory-like domain/TonB dependent receptor-like, beta-barrel
MNSARNALRPARVLWIFVLLFLLFSGLSAGVSAQSTASLSGTVTDASGATVPNAKVVVKNQSTGVESVTQSDGAGAYLFSSLPIGRYRLEVAAPGFQSAVITDLQLFVASSARQDIQLQLGQATEHVEIVANAATVETSTNSIGQVINDKTVQEIPLNGRHFVDLSLLTPGTVTPPANGFLTAPLRGQGSFAINTAGQREDTTNWLVNGINLNDPSQNQVTFQPPVDTLAEYKIDNSTFPAEYGRNSGSIVNLATRSGNNEYHGELFEFFRNHDLDARNFFNPTEVKGVPSAQNPFKRNDFGFDFGGPIKKNKLFFFLAYEGLRQRQGLALSTTVPSAEQIAAAELATPSPAVKQILTLIPAANLFNTAPGSPDVPGDPNSFTRFTGSTAANVSLNQGSADIDFQISSTDRLHGYYVVQKDHRQEPTQNANLPGFGDTRDGLRQLMTFSEDHIFSPSLTNTVRLGYNRIHLIFTPTALDPANFGITLPDGAPVAVGLPNITVSGAFALGGPQLEPQGRGDTTVVLNDTLNWLKGRNTFAFGGEIRRAYNNNIAENVGSFTFTSIPNFLADSASNFTVLLGAGNDKIVQPTFGLFAQDSFKWKPNFTINLGLRYEWNSTPFAANDKFTNFDPTTGDLIPASQPYNTNNKNFEPRIGLAWDPFRDGKTSVRAGYAITTQDPTTNIISGLSGNPPFALPLNIAATGITLENPSAAITQISLGPSAINPDFKNPYAQDWNLSIQRQITSTLVLTAAYVGVKGTHLQINENINQPLLTDGFYNAARPFITLPLTSPIVPAQCAPPNPACTFGNISRFDSPGNSNYNALWLTLNKQYHNGLQFLASYTYSKSFDYSSVSSGDAVPLQNAFNPRGDYGLSEFDVRNRFVLSGFYELPFKGNRLTSGWQVGVITQAQSGSPITPLVNINTGSGTTLTVRPDQLVKVGVTGNPAQFYTNTVICQRFDGPLQGGAPTIPDCSVTPNAAFAIPCTFSAVPASTNPTSSGFNVYPVDPGTCHPGTAPRDGLQGPDFVNTDFSVVKNTKVSERLNLQFRTEFFDVFNHPNFGNPGNVITTGFGTISNTRFPAGDFGSAREIQFALKLLF